MKLALGPFVVFALPCAGYISGCTAAQKDAFFADVERVRDLAGDVCVEHEGWEACLKKCEQAKKESTTDAAPRP